MKIIVALLITVGIAVGGAACYVKYIASSVSPIYRTATITQGDISRTITATGIVVAEEFVDVGAQVAGRIVSFGPDPNSPNKFVDFNSVVHEKMLLATIDQTCYKAQVEQAEATLQSAEASVLQLEAKSEQAKLEWKRAEILKPKKAIADTEYDTAVANYKVAVANVAMGKATVRQAKANLSVAKTNLDYTEIRSPIDGVIVTRRVNVGQTVVASLNAPSLFLIAKDLKRMQVWASVNEAEIGRIGLDTPVEFTVDAVPNRVFHGKVTQIRLNAQTTQNVITFTVVVTTDNLDGKLLPYLTANLQFETDRRNNVVLVPNAALRWKPQTPPDAESKSDTTSSKKPAKLANTGKTRGRIWAADENGIRPIKVEVGVTDNTLTEISGPDVKVGMKVVIGDAVESGSGSADAKSPFVPQIRRKRS
jgi:HlyD family secretion protein